jgi:hypothetical protein
MQQKLDTQLGNAVDCTFYPFGKTEGKHVENVDGKFYPKVDEDGSMVDPRSQDPSPETAADVSSDDARANADLTQRRRDAEKTAKAKP